MTLGKAIDYIFSHNEIVGIWTKAVSDGMTCKELKWSGMAHEIPKEFLTNDSWKIFGTVAEKMCESDRINIVLM